MESATAVVERIRPLSSLLANQIAAGEVVERPASVVKELIENSLDSGADRIELDIESGGARLIRVTDNGRGIHPQDLQLAVSRHATSKIHDPSDLARIASLGFRGEALASIASVSRLELISACPNTPHAWRLCAFGTGDGPEPAAHSVGTTVVVRDLFFNTPARRKFLRSERTEFAHLDDVVRRVALARFDVGILLRHNQRLVHDLRPALGGAERERRLTRLFGGGFTEASLYIDDESAGMRLWGWAAGPGFARSQTDLQYFYVNGRMVRDRLIAHAVRQAYQDILYHGRQPAYLLHLELDPGRVDVNVHPTKHEVRFREARLVHDFLFSSLRGLLSAAAGRSSGSGDGPGVAANPTYVTARPMSKPRVGESLRAYPEPTRTPARAPQPSGRVLAQVEGRYLIVQRGQGLFAVDIAAALQDLARRRLTQGSAVAAQPLLVPCLVAVTPAQAELVARYREDCAALALEVDRTGAEQLVLRALPPMLRAAAPEALLGDVTAALAAAAREAPDVRREHLIAAMVRHAASAAGQRRSNAEQDALLRDLAPLLTDEAGVPPGWWLPLTGDQLRDGFEARRGGPCCP